MLDTQLSEGYAQINVRVPVSLKQKIKKSGIRYARLLEMGFQYYNKRTELDQEVLELREGNKKLQATVSKMGARILELEHPSVER